MVLLFAEKGRQLSKIPPRFGDEVRLNDLGPTHLPIPCTAAENGGSAAQLQLEGLSKKGHFRERGRRREADGFPLPARPARRLRCRSPRCHCWGSRGPSAPSRPRRQRARDARGTTWHRTHSLHCLQRSRAACCAVKQRDREDFVALRLPRAV